MRSGLLAVGVILLVLGAIFYFVPTPASAGTQEDSVTTTTYAEYDNEMQNTADNETNQTDTSSTWTSTRTVSETDRVNTADTDSEGDPVIYVYLDDNGDMYSESGAYLGAGITTSDMTTTVGDRYGSARSNTADTSNSAGTGVTETEVVTDDTTMQRGITDTQNGGVQDSGAQRVNTADSGVYASSDDADTNNTNASSTLFGDDRDNTAAGGAAGGATGSNWIRTLSVLAMVLGAILAILGLILPSRDYDTADHRARTAGPAGRRVRYEREEEHEVRRR